MVVDDYVDGAEMLAEILTDAGYEVRVVTDSAKALRTAEEFLPHIACVDIGMPIMDGYTLAVHLRKLAGLANIHLIAMTGFGTEQDRDKSRSAGFSVHLVKPVTFDDIHAAIRARPASS